MISDHLIMAWCEELIASFHSKGMRASNPPTVRQILRALREAEPDLNDETVFLPINSSQVMASLDAQITSTSIVRRHAIPVLRRICLDQDAVHNILERTAVLKQEAERKQKANELRAEKRAAFQKKAQRRARAKSVNKKSSLPALAKGHSLKGNWKDRASAPIANIVLSPLQDNIVHQFAIMVHKQLQQARAPEIGEGFDVVKNTLAEIMQDIEFDFTKLGPFLKGIIGDHAGKIKGEIAYSALVVCVAQKVYTLQSHEKNADGSLLLENGAEVISIAGKKARTISI